MKNKKSTSEKKVNLIKRIKVRLDYKTVVTINRLESLIKWKRLYPAAKVIH